MKLLLHPVTKQQVERFCAKPSHSLLLTGPLGAGKTSVAQYIAEQLLVLESQKLVNYPYYLHIEPVNDSISIEAIRELKSFTQLKTSGHSAIRRVVIIENADFLTHEAQNAFLKLLEEPPKDTAVILTSSQPRKLLATISSRVQEIAIKRPSKQELFTYFGNDYDESAVIRAYHMSLGSIGLMHTLLTSEQDHPLVESIALAKEILQKTVSERLLMVNDLASSNMQPLLAGLYSVVHAALVLAIEKGNDTMTRRWYSACKHIETAQEQLSVKPSSKLLLSDLFLNL